MRAPEPVWKIWGREKYCSADKTRTSILRLFILYFAVAQAQYTGYKSTVKFFFNVKHSIACVRVERVLEDRMRAR